MNKKLLLFTFLCTSATVITTHAIEEKKEHGALRSYAHVLNRAALAGYINAATDYTQTRNFLMRCSAKLQVMLSVLKKMSDERAIW